MEWTPTQSRILAVLADGRPHPPRELRACLWDDLAASPSAVRRHVSAMRGKLRRAGLDIVCVLQGRGGRYRLVGLLPARVVV